ncbi:hypothetical protein PHYBLDRAFT_141732 [Phycomyces blakesleeanus NRRL 1555(-)]|uniref:Uncharacterized protein n=2 Tax=Phycomyces blakesleeanus TaxID=4837 RepID=A0A167PGH9_PHYB8|nr:hypothetical protein PHYBLDRAFT_141732 [Phycomyces blakesleeanus NRRL 1555(-)]OAD77867.1 hypothetical protein PHYBLDRAFT_141732 [Phycomyces blakesleeanus NRRL 1555(-)]|eukprot:XP_018295907.1 hypothetical protein PHYBLDRAFT_141732 [Phycomyces blakesleeanus NRRL 1555(-)]
MATTVQIHRPYITDHSLGIQWNRENYLRHPWLHMDLDRMNTTIHTSTYFYYESVFSNLACLEWASFLIGFLFTLSFIHTTTPLTSSEADELKDQWEL